jgi:hypothetical protein
MLSISSNLSRFRFGVSDRYSGREFERRHVPFNIILVCHRLDINYGSQYGEAADVSATSVYSYSSMHIIFAYCIGQKSLFLTPLPLEHALVQLDFLQIIQDCFQ